MTGGYQLGRRPQTDPDAKHDRPPAPRPSSHEPSLTESEIRTQLCTQRGILAAGLAAERWCGSAGRGWGRAMSAILNQALAFLDSAVAELDKPARPGPKCSPAEWRRYQLALHHWTKASAVQGPSERR
jgi:hypothetical protein